MTPLNQESGYPCVNARPEKSHDSGCLVSVSYIENIRHAHVLVFQELALRGFDFGVRRRPISCYDDLLPLFGKQVIDEQRSCVRMTSIGAEKHQARTEKQGLHRRKPERRSLLTQTEHGVQIRFHRHSEFARRYQLRHETPSALV